MKIVSRFAGAPDEIAVELDEDGWRSLGTVEAAARRSKREEVLALLGDEPLTLEELLAAGGLTSTNARTVRRRLDELVEHDLALRTGEGKRLDPFRWELSENGRFFRDSPEIGLSRKPDGDPGDPSVHAENSPSGFVTDSPGL